MPAPLDSSRPRLAAGCHWGKQGEDRVVLVPEGMIRLQGTGQSVLELCDGERTLLRIVETLSKRYSTDTAKIRGDVATFLEALQQKRVVDY
ncbi:MAG TPA: pyrroloquinoline quinone biosynthesis peptide chaperone PqqD [Terriglobales bacterium]|nr:pyrroloquinoline quinone biosynthesis peptide chaperone PqqD [Terriglobales bacterium]